MKRISGKVSQITRITQRPSWCYPRRLRVATLPRLSQIPRIPQISQIGFAALIGFHRYLPDGNLRNSRDFFIRKVDADAPWRVPTRWDIWGEMGNLGNLGILGVMGGLGGGREEVGRGSEGEGTGEGCGVELVSGWRAHCENREGAVAGARRSTVVSEPVRASSRCAARSHQAPSHRFSRALGLLVLLGLPKERKQFCQKNGNRKI